ncbi:MAG: Gfo/Idh/MocA family oxidoreductase, partial [Pseudomonadota bacterium]
MSTELRYGIIGCGMMGQEHMRNIALLDGARVVAIFDPDPGMRAAAQALVPDARVAETLGDLLAIAEVNALLIASPNHIHVAQVEEIARTRPLPLMVEKPLFTAPDQADRIDACVAGYPAPIWVAMEYRYMPPIAAFLAQAEAATGGIRMLTIREHRF